MLARGREGISSGQGVLARGRVEGIIRRQGRGASRRQGVS